MSSLQRYLGQFRLGTSRLNFTITDPVMGAQALTLTDGDYFMAGYTGETTAQFCEHMQAVIRAAHASQATSTVTLEAGTGIVAIAFGSGQDTSVTWTDATLATMLGYAGNLSGSQTYVAPNQAQYIWLPAKGLADYPGYKQDWWAKQSTTRTMRAPTGQTFSRAGNLLNDAKIEYMYLPESNVWAKGSTWHASFEAFFEDVIHAGQPFRCYPDLDSNTSTTYKTAILATDEGETVGNMKDFAERNITRYNNFWKIKLSLWEYVA